MKKEVEQQLAAMPEKHRNAVKGILDFFDREYKALCRREREAEREYYKKKTD